MQNESPKAQPTFEERDRTSTSEILSTTPFVAGDSSRFLALLDELDKTTLGENYQGQDTKIVKIVKESIKCLAQVFYLYGFRPINRKATMMALIKGIERMLSFLILKGNDQWMAYLKYKCCNFYAFFETEGSDLIPTLSGLEGDRADCVLGGVFYMYQKRLQREDMVKFRSFYTTILQSKMGMPRPGKDMVEAAVKKTVTHLTTEPIRDEPEVVILGGRKQVILSRDTMKAQIVRTVREMFDGVILRNDDMYEPFFPSTSANYNRGRGGGGAVTTIMDLIHQKGLAQSEERLVQCKVEKVIVSGKLTQEFSSTRVLDQQKLDEDMGEEEVLGLIWDDKILKQHWKTTFDHIVAEAITESPLVEAVGLSEALKVRVISKGPPKTYTALKPLQKFLWSKLKTQKVFKLIGTPVTEDEVNNVFGEMTGWDQIVNGDYKASTDNLKSWTSECAAHAIIDILNENGVDESDSFFLSQDWREMFLRALTGHVFVDTEGRYLPQKEGQLMGSIISFPFLCLINAAMCRWALELSDGCQYRVRDAPIFDDKGRYVKRARLMINGDDCTMKSNNPSVIRLWESITAYGGLMTSVGKTLYSLRHRPVVVINSQTFDYNWEEKRWSVRRYVNMGILKGQKRSVALQEKSSSVAADQLGSLHRELYSTCPKDIWKVVSEMFICFNRTALEKYPGIPWDVPEYLGGIGLVPVDNEIGYFNRVACSLIIRDGLLNNIQKEQPAISWNMHKLTMKEIREYKIEKVYFSKVRKTLDYFNLDFWNDEFCAGYEEIDDNFSKLYKYYTVEQLFTRKVSDIGNWSSDKLEPLKNPYSNNALRKNQKIWRNVSSKLAKTGCKVDGLKVRTTEDLLYKKDLASIPVMLGDFLPKEEKVKSIITMDDDSETEISSMSLESSDEKDHVWVFDFDNYIPHPDYRFLQEWTVDGITFKFNPYTEGSGNYRTSMYNRDGESLASYQERRDRTLARLTFCPL